MNDPSTNSPSISEVARCQHRTATGKRCRLSVTDARSGLCFRHTNDLLSRLQIEDLRALLAGDTSEFKTADEINDFLSRLLLRLSEGRVPPRRGAVLAYVCNLLLRTLPAIKREIAAEREQFPPSLNFDGIINPPPRRQPQLAEVTSGAGARPQT